ncbi:MAG: hypothetical protein FGM24_01930 [Candidatus Kapabacteria bacterium]|nr:hypothetical protein [Candidatus Kapabacteria bacterium]
MRNFMIAVLTVTALPVYGQALVNLDFEEWKLFKGQLLFRDYEEPTGWTSGNGVIHVAPNTDALTSKSSDASSGSYCVQMTTRNIFGQIAAGTCYTGKFEINLSDPVKSAKLGIPYTDRPAVFAGMHRYAPVNNDSATLYCVLSKWDGSAQRRVTVGEARHVVYKSVPTWTPFSFPIEYGSSDAPDTITVVFAASAGGDLMKGEVGSTLWIDAVHIGAATSVAVTPETHGAVTVVDRIMSTQVSDHAMSTVTVYALDGRRLWQEDVNGPTLYLGGIPSGPVLIEIGLQSPDGSHVCHRLMTVLP